MADANGLVEALKRAAVEAVRATKPVNVYFGKVVGVAPLRINVEQKMTLGEKQLVLSRNVTDHDIAVTVEWETAGSLGTHAHTVSGEDGAGDAINLTTGQSSLVHAHSITGRKTVTVHNGLVVGDKVILVRRQEGQRFLVLDRVGGAT